MLEGLICQISRDARRASRWRGWPQPPAWARVVLVVGLLVGGGLRVSCTAFALSQRGHAFAFSFADNGEAEGKVFHPAGLAVNEASGDVYVVDAGDNRIERFGAEGKFIAAWGWGVSDGKAEYEVCSAACKVGIPGEGEGQLDAPEAIAIDNSTSPEDPSHGDLYVLSDTVAQNNVIEKFTPNGEPVGPLHFNGESPGSLGGVAVDAKGLVSVSDLGSSQVIQFGNGSQNEDVSEVGLEAECVETHGLAVDALSETLYVSHQLPNLLGECPEVARSSKAPAVVARLGGKGGLQSEALDFENTSAVSVDLASNASTPLGEAGRGDVYIDNLTSLAAFTPDGSLIQRFGSEQLSQGAGVAVNASSGDIYLADAKANKVDVFEPEPPGAPTVDNVSFQKLAPTSGRLQADIDPHGNDTHYYFQYGTGDCRATPSDCSDLPGAPGTDIGAGFGAQSVSAAAEGLTPGTIYFYRVIAANEGGQTEGAQRFQTFTTPPSGSDVLPDGRAFELVSPPDKHGALIYPIGGSTANSAPGLGVIESSKGGGAITYATSAPIGEDVSGNRALEASQVISTRDPQRWLTQNIVTPHSSAEGITTGPPQEYRAFSPDLLLGLVQPYGLEGSRFQEPALTEGASSEERGLYLRQNVSCQATPASCYAPLVTPEGDTAKEPFGGELEFESASPDLQHVVFSSNVALSSSSPSVPGLYEWNAGRPPAEALQLVSALPGNTKAAQEAQLGDFNPGFTSLRNAVSTDGQRVFWGAQTEEHGQVITHLYMRQTTTEQTIALNLTQGIKEANPEENTDQEVHFRGASADGSRVFFTDTFPLTSQSKLSRSEEGPADLYACEITQRADGLGCNLTDLTVDPGYDFGESAEFVGTILGTSDDGAYVYFVANGILSSEARAAGANQGHCAARPSSQANPDATCNLYVAHYDSQAKEWQSPRFIAKLSQEDAPDWGSNSTGTVSLASLTARVSPDGRYLAFMSNEPLTGYDNVDASEAARGARDEEVFLYDAQENRLVCASCNPSGGERKGILDHETSGEGHGLLVDRYGIWQETGREEKGGAGGRNALDHWLAGSIPGWTPVDARTAIYQSRYLSDEGRLFFDSPDALVPHDTNGLEDVYEYEPQGLGSCPSSQGCVALISSGESDRETAFLDASENGNDVFFLTSQPLSSADHDTAYDVYDAHVCSEASPCIPAPPNTFQGCEALETCRPLAPSAQAFPGPTGSAALTGPGNAAPNVQTPVVTSIQKPLTRAQKLASALRTCRKKYKTGKKRASCERQAHRRYAPHARTHKARKAKRESKR